MVLKENAKREKERERERGPHKEAKPPNLLIISLLGLPFFAYVLGVAPAHQLYM